jgi:hypothetical protein
MTHKEENTKAKSKSEENPVCVYDFRLSMENLPKEDLMEWLNGIAKKWVFQGEKGEINGYLHWQGRLSLKVKKRKHLVEQMIAKFTSKYELNGKKLGYYVAPTSKANQDNNFYVMKEETRTEGPYQNSDKAQQVIFDEYKGEIKWKPWQHRVLEEIKKKPDNRTINIVFDEGGNIGKTFLVTYLSQLGLANLIPPYPKAKEIIEVLYAIEEKECYVFDLPRAVDKKSLRQIYTAIEMLKNGYVTDRRYAFKKKWIKPPHIWVFTHTLDAIETLSKDKVRIWTLNNDGSETFDAEGIRYESSHEEYDSTPDVLAMLRKKD